MHERANRKVGLLMQATFLSCFLCNTDGGGSVSYAPVKVIDKLKCSDESFNCGNVGYISYPFWGGSRGVECGREPFQIICSEAGVPLLTISSLSYAIQRLDFPTNTLTVARQDLQNTTCPKLLHNTTLDLTLFRYPPKSDDENVTLFFDCTGADPSQLNTFRCPDDQQAINLFRTGDASSGPGAGITCKNNIFVPANNEEVAFLQKPTTSSINVLLYALTSGFSIQWLDDGKQNQTPTYNALAYRCCNFGNMCRRDLLHSSAVPQGYQEDCSVQSPRSSTKGMPPVQSPGYASESPRYNRQVIKGMPPSQSPGDPPQSFRKYPLGNGMPPTQSSGNPPLSFRFNHPIGNGSNAKKSHKKIVTGVAVSVAGVIILYISISCFLKRRHLVSGPNPKCKQDVNKLLLQNRSLTPKRYRYSEIRKMTQCFRDKLGQGGYGSVYKGMLPDGCPVAVKVLIETDGNGEEFINEVASISRTSHVNIVTLLGFCHDRNKRAIVYEFMPNKSLDKFLSSSGSVADTDCCLDLKELHRIAVGIAKGLEYLHTGCSTRIVHFDIKPQNILLDDDFCPKISDFGLAKLCKKQQSILSVLGTRGTAGYIAPEVFSRNFGGVSHKSDVYSYGMMVLEMAGARKLTKADVIQSSENYFPDKIYEQVIIDVTKELDDFMIEDEEETRRKMFVVGFWCIQTVPLDRPSMSKVVEMLEGSLKSIQIPPKPFLFSPHLPMQETSSTLPANVETEYSAHA